MRLVGLILLATTLLAACSPHDFDSCMEDASRRQNAAGVQVAVSQCDAKFKEPERKAAAAERAAKLAKRHATWSASHEKWRSFDQVAAEMGEPDEKVRVNCEDEEGDHKSCWVHAWFAQEEACDPPSMFCKYVFGVRRSGESKGKVGAFTKALLK